MPNVSFFDTHNIGAVVRMRAPTGRDVDCRGAVFDEKRARRCHTRHGSARQNAAVSRLPRSSISISIPSEGFVQNPHRDWDGGRRASHRHGRKQSPPDRPAVSRTRICGGVLPKRASPPCPPSGRPLRWWHRHLEGLADIAHLQRPVENTSSTPRIGYSSTSASSAPRTSYLAHRAAMSCSFSADPVVNIVGHEEARRRGDAA